MPAIPRRSVVVQWSVAIAGMLFSACGKNADVPLTIEFPTELALLATDRANITIYDVDASSGVTGADLCDAALAGDAPPDGAAVLLTTGEQSPCVFAEGGVVFRDIPAGNYAFWVEGVSPDGGSVVRGCVAGPIDLIDAGEALFFQGTETTAVTVELQAQDYVSTIESVSCADIDAKCDDDVACDVTTTP